MRFLNYTGSTDWDIVANRCDEIDGLSEEEKIKVKKAFSFLKNEFGVDYLKEVGNEHYFYFHIHNYAPPSRLWFAYVAEMIERVKDFSNYNSLLKRLKNPKKFREAYTVLETAYNYGNDGFNIEFDPVINIKSKNKVPDLKLINVVTKEELICEVSISFTSVKQNEAFDNETEIFNAVISNDGLEFAGRVIKTLSEIEKSQIKNTILNFAESVKEGNGFGVLVIEDVLLLGYATPENVKKLEDWAKNNGCNVRSFEGPYFDVDEIRRIENKINEKKRQLPYDNAGIIMIYDSDFFHSIRSIQEAVVFLEKTLAKISNIAAVIIQGKFMGSINPLKIRIGKHLFIQKMGKDTFVEKYLIIWNEHCSFKLTEDTISKIYWSIE